MSLIAGLTALQRLALTTMDLPIHLSVLMALTNLSIGHLSPWSQAAASQMQVALFAGHLRFESPRLCPVT